MLFIGIISKFSKRKIYIHTLGNNLNIVCPVFLCHPVEETLAYRSWGHPSAGLTASPRLMKMIMMSKIINMGGRELFNQNEFKNDEVVVMNCSRFL